MDKKRKKEYDLTYMEMAKVLSKLSYAHRSKVGALIVNPEGQIISQGYNGTPSGMNNDCEIPKCKCDWPHGCCSVLKCQKEPELDFCEGCEHVELTTKPEVLHAESNAIVKCAKNGCGSTDGCTLYVTLSPCFDCSKLIIQAGIKRVVFKDIYRDTRGLDILINNGVIVDQINLENYKMTRYEGTI